MRRATSALLTHLCLMVAVSSPAIAVDTTMLNRSPELSSARAKIKEKDFAGAIAELKPMLDTHQHADVYNLLGFSYRKSGDYGNAATFYAKALELDADHKGALEYQGEMFVELGDLARARINLDRLVKLCPRGCEERDDLEKALAAAPKQ